MYKPEDHVLVRTSVYDEWGRTVGSGFFITKGELFYKLAEEAQAAGSVSFVNELGDSFDLHNAFEVVDLHERITEEQYKVFKELDLLEEGWPVYNDILEAIWEKQDEHKEKHDDTEV